MSLSNARWLVLFFPFAVALETIFMEKQVVEGSGVSLTFAHLTTEADQSQAETLDLS